MSLSTIHDSHPAPCIQSTDVHLRPSTFIFQVVGKHLENDLCATCIIIILENSVRTPQADTVDRVGDGELRDDTRHEPVVTAM